MSLLSVYSARAVISHTPFVNTSFISRYYDLNNNSLIVFCRTQCGIIYYTSKQRVNFSQCGLIRKRIPRGEDCRCVLIIDIAGVIFGKPHKTSRFWRRWLVVVVVVVRLSRSWWWLAKLAWAKQTCWGSTLRALSRDSQENREKQQDEHLLVYVLVFSVSSSLSCYLFAHAF